MSRGPCTFGLDPNSGHIHREAVRILSLELRAHCTYGTLLGVGELILEEPTDFSRRYNSDPYCADTFVISWALGEGLKFRFQPSVICAHLRAVGHRGER